MRNYPFRDRIGGLDEARAVEGAEVLCAGVATDGDGQLVTAGGRVLDVVGTGATVAEARAVAYESLSHVRWPGIQARSDIAAQVVDAP